MTKYDEEEIECSFCKFKGKPIIEKNKIFNNETKPFLACPISKKPLNIIRGNYYCSNSLLLYPIIDNIPCLLPENAVIATHYMEEISL